MFPYQQNMYNKKLYDKDNVLGNSNLLTLCIACVLGNT